MAIKKFFSCAYTFFVVPLHVFNSGYTINLKYIENMKNDFLKFAVDKGMNSMHVEKTMNASASYISPSILEERQLNEIGRAHV